VAAGIKMSIINVDELKRTISDAFGWRAKPIKLSASSQIGDADLLSVNKFYGLSWYDLTEDLLRDNFEAFSFFAQDAYCYYLPGVMKITIDNQRFDYLAVLNIVGMLDRSPVVEYWDELFTERWTSFSLEELNVIENWLLFMAFESLNVFESNSLDRAIETIELLKNTSTQRE
jgi:hypothetical protein